MTPKKRLLVHVGLFIILPLLLAGGFFSAVALGGSTGYMTAREAAAKACGVTENEIRHSSAFRGLDFGLGSGEPLTGEGL